MTTWLLCTVAFTILLSAAARLAEAALPPARARRHIWISVMLLSVVVPMLALLSGGRFPGAVFGSRKVVELPAVLATWSGDVGAAALDVESTTPGTGWSWLLVATWLILSMVLLAGYVAVWLRFIGSASEWRAGSLHGQSVRVAKRVGPAVFGLTRPIIVVPEWVLGADPAVQRLIVLHELEHTRARDHVLLALAPFALIVMPWNVPLWWQIHRLRLATELDCDRRVLSRGVRPHDYGSLLIDIAGRADPLPSALAALGGPRTSLERRIIAMSTRTPSYWRSRAAVLTAAAALLLITALETFAVMAPAAVVRIVPDATIAEPAPAGDVASTAQSASTVAASTMREDALTLAADTPIVVVDGVIIRDVDIEKTVGGATIATIEMVRGAEAVRRFGAQAAAGVLLITTARGQTDRPRGVPVEAAPSAADAAAAADRARRTAIRVQGATEEAAARRLRVEAASAGGPQPLYIIDGVLSTTMPDIDPDSIESIEVVKGAAAEALYGERAAGGVIRITTKK